MADYPPKELDVYFNSTVMMTTLTGSDNNITIDFVPSTKAALTLRTLLLIFFASFGLFGNIGIFVIVLRSKPSAVASFSWTILNLSMIHILQCVVAMPFVTVSSIADVWILGQAACSFYSFTVLVLITMKNLSWLTVSIERVVYTRLSPLDQPKQSNFLVVVIIVGTWTYSVLFAIPVLTHYSSIYFPMKFICIFDPDGQIVFSLVVLLTCFVIPILATLILSCILLKSILSERIRVGDSQSVKISVVAPLPSRPASSTINGDFRDTTFTFYSLILFLVWLILELPFIILLFTRILCMTLTFKFQCDSTSVVDTVFTWMMFSYPAVSSIIMFRYFRVIHVDFSHCIPCYTRTTSSLNSDSSLSSTRLTSHVQLHCTTPRSHTPDVPVLFATQDGMHVKTCVKNYTLQKHDDDITRCSTNQNIRKCDVFQTLDCSFFEDTSDYESSDNLDPLSVSHPMSKTSRLPRLQHRSTSDSNIYRTKLSSKNNHLFELPTAGYYSNVMDSGIDMRHSSEVLNSFPNVSLTPNLSKNISDISNAETGIALH